DAHARARDHGGCGRGGPHLHDPDGRAGGAAAPVHRGQCARGEEPGHLMRAAPPGMRGVALALSLLVVAGRAGARMLPEMAPPELSVAAGGTLAVNGAPGKGGAAAALGLTWPFARRWTFGGALFAQDLGTGFADLRDPNTGALLGTVATVHRWSFGG